MVSNEYLDSTLFPLCQSYRGCFSSDNIPSIKKENLKTNNNFIVNLSRQNEPGSHFIALIITPDSAYYFDSFGNTCQNKDIINYLKVLGKKNYYNDLPIQSVSSDMCGFYCALQCLKYDENCTKKNLKLMFHTENLEANDNLCIRYIKKVLSHWNFHPSSR
jgi:hypothetical protein